MKWCKQKEDVKILHTEDCVCFEIDTSLLPDNMLPGIATTDQGIDKTLRLRKPSLTYFSYAFSKVQAASRVVMMVLW